MESWSHLAPSASIGAVLLAGAAMYGAGMMKAWLHGGRRRGIGLSRAIAFWVGLAMLAGTVLLPIRGFAMESVSAHMVQHAVLLQVVALLIMWGHPALALLWALPARKRRAAARAWRGFRLSHGWRTARNPVSVLGLYVGVLWLWHLPRVYDAAIGNEWLHGAQHASYLLAGIALWGRVLDWAGRGQAGLAHAAAFLFIAMLAGGFLAAALAFAQIPWYESHPETSSLADVGALLDQQVAGMGMLMFGGITYFLVAMIFLSKLLQDAASSER